MLIKDIWAKSLWEAYEEVQALVYSRRSELVKLSELAIETLKSGNKIMICGNGGSHADAMHFAEELTGRFRKDRKPLSAMALCTNSTHITCVSNDYGFESIFKREVEAFGKKGDLLILLSTSGDSGNLLWAENKAREMNIKTFALLGKTGGRLKDQAENHIIVPGKNSDRIQELHMMILHILVETIEDSLICDV